MNREIRDKWIAALRSGKYVKGEGVLRNTKDQFCTLGVLCNIINPDEWKKSPVWKDRYLWHSSTSTLNGEIAKDIGISWADVNSISFMNDDVDETSKKYVPIYTFNDMANWIEENL